MVKLLMGRYELVEKIGEGGMAVVYKAKDRLLNRYVAVKILRPEYTRDAQFVDSFRRESQAAAGLESPNIISIYDVGREGNIHFIVMEYIDGMSLSDVIKVEAPMDYKAAIAITKQIASALSVAHSHNIIHRDIKPHNIMMKSDGTAKLGDFGIAKAVSDSTLTETSKIIGSVHYFSPEQARGSYVDERSDIYSLGIILYEMLTGKVPFDGDNPVQVALMHINDEIIPPSKLVPGIPPQLEKIVMKATDKFQTNRYASADEMLEDLNSIEFVSNTIGDQAVFAQPDLTQTIYEARNEDLSAVGYGNNDDDDYEEEDKPEKKGKKKKKKGALIAGIMIALIALGAAAFAGWYYFLREEPVKMVEVPEVAGMTYSQAKELLKAKGLEIERGDDVKSDTYDKGEVVSQDPDKGEEVEEGSTVTVNISAGAETAQVPNMIGKYYSSDTVTVLKSNNFDEGDIKYEKSDDFEEGQIIDQDPKAGTTREVGTKINLTVCSGKKTEEVAVPSLTGLTLEKAESKLKKAGLQRGQVDYEQSDVYGEGFVMWQQYQAGTAIKKGTKVDIIVSQGSPEEEPERSPEPEDETEEEQDE